MNAKFVYDVVEAWERDQHNPYLRIEQYTPDQWRRLWVAGMILAESLDQYLGYTYMVNDQQTIHKIFTIGEQNELALGEPKFLVLHIDCLLLFFSIEYNDGGAISKLILKIEQH